MTIVIDASVAAKWLFDESDAELAAEYLSEDLIAPELLRLECANAVIKRMRLAQLSDDEARERLTEIGSLPVQLIPVDEAATIELAFALSHPVYDCAYLALARARNLHLVTADRRFAKAAEAAGYCARIRLLGGAQL